MSVILDALRRARRGQEAHPGRPLAARRPNTTTRLPTGLGLGATPHVVARPTRTRWVAMAALIVVVLGGWAAVQVARRLGASDTSPTRTPVSTQARTPAKPPAAAPVAPKPTSPIVSKPTEPPTAPVIESATSTRAVTPAPVPPARIVDSATSSRQHFEQAVKHHIAGKLDDAAKEYLAAIAQDDRDVEARNNLGLLYRARGESAAAIEQFRRALAVDPRYAAARNHLAVLLIDAGRFVEARRELNQGLALDPRSVDLAVNLALVEKGERHDDRAMELLLTAVGDRPGHAAAQYNLALLYDERRSYALAYDHYTDFLATAGPEYSTAIPNVRRRVQALATLLDATTN
jgi:Tfp pilus assembly protein PilF